MSILIWISDAETTFPVWAIFVPPFMGALMANVIWSPVTLASVISIGSPSGPAVVPVSFSPSCLKVYVRSILSPLGVLSWPFHVPVTSPARARAAAKTRASDVLRAMRMGASVTQRALDHKGERSYNSGMPHALMDRLRTKCTAALSKAKRLWRPKPDSPEDPYSYVGAPTKPRLPHLRAAAKAKPEY